VRKSILGHFLAVAVLWIFVLFIDLEERHNYISSVMGCRAAFWVSYCWVLVQKKLWQLVLFAFLRRMFVCQDAWPKCIQLFENLYSESVYKTEVTITGCIC